MKKFTTPFLSACLFLLPKASLSAEAANPSPEQGFVQTIVMISIALLFFYFILWRPEQKKRKEMEAQRTAMKKGDRVIAMGIVGSVSKIKEETVIVRMVDGSEIEFLKAAISSVNPSAETIKKEEQ
jgi:preprotein translocase subunit YajC